MFCGKVIGVLSQAHSASINTNEGLKKKKEEKKSSLDSSGFLGAFRAALNKAANMLIWGQAEEQKSIKRFHIT